MRAAVRVAQVSKVFAVWVGEILELVPVREGPLYVEGMSTGATHFPQHGNDTRRYALDVLDAVHACGVISFGIGLRELVKEVGGVDDACRHGVLHDEGVPVQDAHGAQELWSP